MTGCAVIPLLACVASCRLSASLDSHTDGNGVNSSGCELGTGNSDCDACFHAACLTECTTATQVDGISEYTDCTADCLDQSCMEACGTLSADGRGG